METLKGTKRKLSSAFPKSPRNERGRYNLMLKFLNQQSRSTAPTHQQDETDQKLGSYCNKESSYEVIQIDSDNDSTEGFSHEYRNTTALTCSISPRNPSISSSDSTACYLGHEIPFPTGNFLQKELKVISLIDDEATTHLSLPKPKSAGKISSLMDQNTRNKIISSCIDLTFHDSDDCHLADVCSDDRNDVVCIVCDIDLSSLDEVNREEHLHKCLDDKGIDGPEYSQSLPTNSIVVDIESDRGLRLPVFFCVLCDIDLSKRNLVHRCLHLKRCAREKSMSTKQLLQFIAPIDEQEKDSDDDAEDLDDVGQESSTVSNRQSDENKQSQDSKSKNALLMLMSSARDQSKMKSMFESVKPTSKDSTHKQQRRVTAAGRSGAGSGHTKTSAGKTGYAPAYKKIQVGSMTCPIVVDGFQYACPLLSDCYFLTHFHSDHYMGLNKDFNCGQIYCTRATAALVKLKLNVSLTRIVALELDRQYIISVGGLDVEVTLTDANHCPGAACVIFRFPTLNRTILHTGDFRWTSNLIRTSSVFRQLSVTADSYNIKNLTVYLDTTYCDEQYCFPHQDLAINAVIDCIREESKRPGALYVFGAYAIGKERVFMAAAEELDLKVYVDKARWKAMLCFDWTTEQQARLTTDPNITDIWVVPLNHINFNALEKLKRQKPRCNRVVAFQPTGWTHNNNGNRFNHNERKGTICQQPDSVTDNSPIVHARRKEGHVIYSVAYSEHSSFRELVDFVSIFKPFRIIPTVNTSVEKVQKQLELLKTHSKQIYGGCSEVAKQVYSESQQRHTEDSAEEQIPLERQISGPSRLMTLVSHKTIGQSLDIDKDDFISEFR